MTPHVPEEPAATLIFLHIPRTAGTTFKQILARQYGADRVYETQAFLLGEADSLRDLPLSRKTEIDVLSGHVAYGVHELLPRASRYITLLRDPVRRVASLYRYVSEKHVTKLTEVIRRDKLSLRDFVESEVAVDHTHNGQTRMLGGDLHVPRDDIDVDLLLQQAKRRAEHEIAAVGISERFDESLVLFKHVLAWERPVLYLRRNETGAGKLERLSPEEISVIRAHNEADLDLYEHGLRLFTSRTKSIRFFPLRAATFRVANKAAKPLLERRLVTLR